MEVLDRVYWHNSLRQYLIAAALAFGIMLIVRLIVRVLLKRIEKLTARTETSLDDTIVHVLGATRAWITIIVALYAGSLLLELPIRLRHYGRLLAVIVFLIQVGIWASTAVKAGILRWHQKKAARGDQASLAAVQMIGLAARVLTWSIVFILILDNLGVDITALVAGLGIGGIAIALAAQNILGDVFASMSIMLDKPFEVGDTINLGEFTGTVEKIGIKTTRLRSLSGEELIMANNDLLTSRLRNYKRMEERRSLFVISVTYQTPPDTLESMGATIKKLIDEVEGTRFDRAHFRSFGAASLDFEIVFYILEPDYLTYMEKQEKVNLAILRKLNDMGVEFAYPTQTLYVHREDKAA